MSARQTCTCSSTLRICPACSAWGITESKRDAHLSVAGTRGEIQRRLHAVEQELRTDPAAQEKGSFRRNQLLKSRAHFQRRLKNLERAPEE